MAFPISDGLYPNSFPPARLSLDKIRTWVIDGLIFTNDGFPHGAVVNPATYRDALVDVPAQGGDASVLRS